MARLCRPGVLVVRVTFDQPMSCKGFFTSIPKLKNPCPGGQQHWIVSFDRKTIRTVCHADGNVIYGIGVSDNPDATFLSLSGKPLDPYEFRFSTTVAPDVLSTGESLDQDPESQPPKPEFEPVELQTAHVKKLVTPRLPSWAPCVAAAEAYLWTEGEKREVTMRTLTLAAVALLASSGAALAAPASVNVTVGPELQLKAQKTLGVRDIDDLAKSLQGDVEKRLAKTGAFDGARIDLVLVDAQPNRPTFEQLSRTPGLSLRSFGIGGARIEGRAVAADGAVTPLAYDYYSPGHPLGAGPGRLV